MRDRLLVDTSVWIAYFKNKDASLSEKVEDVLDAADVHVPKVVMAELLQGARSEREISAIEEFVEAFSIVEESADTWQKAGKLSYSMKRKGLTVHLIDCYIAVLAHENGCKIFSLDEHFKGIRRFLKVELYK